MARSSANPAAKLSRILPKPLRLMLERSMIYAQVQAEDFSSLIGSLMVFMFIVAAVVTLFVFVFTSSPLLALIVAIGSFFGVFFLVKVLYDMMADKISAQIEKVLPDMLMLMAANLRAGMIPETSFLASIKPEFGKMNILLSHAAIEVQGGKDFSDALIEMASRTTSRFFRDTMRIIGEGLRSGAELHLILENLATNILQNETIRNDMRAQVRSYAMFIFLASTIAAPLLYGVASFLIGILDGIGSLSSSSTQVPISGAGIGGSFASFSLPQISTTLILIVSVLNVAITTTSSALLGGILNSGKAKDGLKSVPIYLLIGIAIFFAVRFGVSTFFSSSAAGSIGGV